MQLQFFHVKLLLVSVLINLWIRWFFVDSIQGLLLSSELGSNNLTAEVYSTILLFAT
jgi:hypothetical protein